MAVKMDETGRPVVAQEPRVLGIYAGLQVRILGGPRARRAGCLNSAALFFVPLAQNKSAAQKPPHPSRSSHRRKEPRVLGIYAGRKSALLDSLGAPIPISEAVCPLGLLPAASPAS
jgi:hypothetical protein